MKKRLKIIFYIVFFSFTLITVFRSTKTKYNAYNSTLEHYDYYINQIDTVSVSIKATHLRKSIKVDKGLDNKEVIYYIKESISKSTRGIGDREKKVFDYIGTLYLRSSNKDFIRITIDFDQNSDIVWFKIHKENEVFGIYHKYIDTEMYWHNLLTDVLESNNN